jgi:hypothetical protein
MKDSLRFSVFIPVKPYVKRYLEINYGNPVTFRDEPKHQAFVCRLLKKPNQRSDAMYSDTLVKFTDEVEVKISKDDFMRHGFEMSKTSIVAFGKYFEDLAKFKARNYIELKRGFRQLKDSITDFQQLFGMEEEYWSYEAIKKDIDRNGSNSATDFTKNMNDFVNKMYLDHLLKAKMITGKGYQYYLERI